MREVSHGSSPGALGDPPPARVARHVEHRREGQREAVGRRLDGGGAGRALPKSGSNAAASASGIGNTVRWPWTVSKPKTSGMPSRVSSSAQRCASRVRSRPHRFSMLPTRPARIAAA